MESAIDEWALFSSFELWGYGLTAQRNDGVKGRLCVVVVQQEAPRCCWLLLYVSASRKICKRKAGLKVGYQRLKFVGKVSQKSKRVVGKLSSEVQWLG